MIESALKTFMSIQIPNLPRVIKETEGKSNFFADCYDVKQKGKSLPGIYEVQVDSQTRVKALCDAQGWTVIQVGYNKPSLKIGSVNNSILLHSGLNPA